VPWAVRESITLHRDRLLKPGDPVDGRRIVVFTEQGLGDTIMFARYAAMVAELGSTVYLEVQTGMRAALHGLVRVAAIYEFGEHLPEFDLHCPLMQGNRVKISPLDEGCEEIIIPRSHFPPQA